MSKRNRIVAILSSLFILFGITACNNGSLNDLPMDSSSQNIENHDSSSIQPIDPTFPELNAPVLDGIKIMTESPFADEQSKENLSINLLSNENTEIGNRPSENEIVVPKDNMEVQSNGKDIEELLPDTSKGETIKDVTYALPNQKVYACLSILNPKKYPILKFVMNNEIYQSYQFEKGSNTELVVVELDAGNNPGLKEFKVTELKYTETETNLSRPAKINEENTAKMVISYDKEPTVDVFKEEINFNTYSATFNVIDKDNLIKTDSDLKVSLSDGNQIIDSINLVKGQNNVKFNNLKTGINYQYMVSCVYDDYSPLGLRRHILNKNNFTTTNVIKVNDIVVTKDSIEFNYNYVNHDNKITDIILFDDKEAAISKVNNNVNKFIGLKSNIKYEIRFYYSVNINGKNYVYYDHIYATTKELFEPKVNIFVEVIDTTLKYEIFVDDDENITTLDNVKLYTSNNEFILKQDPTLKEIKGLKRNIDYVLEVNYTYDLNDGKGPIKKAKKVEFTTSKTIPTVEIEPFNATSDTIEFDLYVSDPNMVGKIESIRLYGIDGKYLQTLENNDLRIFRSLKQNTQYRVEVVYSYDLDDGKGQQLATYDAILNTAKLAPTVDLSGESTTESITIKHSIDDRDEAGSLTKYEIFDEKGSLVKTIENPTNDLLIENLLSGHKYKVVSTYVYDLQDESGNQVLNSETIITTIAKQVPDFNIKFTEKTYDNFKYYFNKQDEDNILKIDSIELLLGGKSIKEMPYNELSEYLFDNLYSNNRYTIRVKYHYDLNDGEGIVSESKDFFVTTTKRNNISYEYKNMKAEETAIAFDYNIVDTDNLSRIDAIEIYKDNVLVEKSTDPNKRRFDNLERESFYTIVTKYSYDLGDGKGIINDSKSILYGTRGSKLFVESLEVLNNQTPLVGEQVQVRVKIDNPNNIQISAIEISGVKCPIKNNPSNYQEIIVGFVPNTIGGYLDVEVTGYEQVIAGTPIMVNLTSPFKEKIVVMGNIEIEDIYPIYDHKYGYAKTPIYLIKLNNPTGYKVTELKSMGREGNTGYFKQIDDNHIIYYGSEYLNIDTISYGLLGQETITKTIKKVSAITRTYENIIHIKTVDDFKKMSQYGNSNVYILDNDIDLKGQKWDPIKARGVFDGNGHSIKNPTIVIENDAYDETNIALFSRFEGVIHDLTVDNIYYSIKSTKEHNVAGIVADRNATLSNCQISGKIILDAPGKAYGLKGNTDYSSSSIHYIENCLVNNLVIEAKKGSGYLIADSDKYRKDDEYYVSNDTIYNAGCYVIGNSQVKYSNRVSYQLFENSSSEKDDVYNDLENNLTYTLVTNTDLGNITKEGSYIKNIDVTRPGYFVSWYDNPEFNNQPVQFPYVNEENPNLYAKWERIELANPKYTYVDINEYKKDLNYDQQRYLPKEGWIIKDLGGLEKTETNFVIGGYYKGKKVIGFDSSVFDFMIYDINPDGTKVLKENARENALTYNVYLLDTLLIDNMYIPGLGSVKGNVYHNDNHLEHHYSKDYRADYFNKKYEDDINRIIWNNSYMYEGAEIHYFNDNENPFDNVVTNAPSDDSLLKINVDCIDILNIQNQYKKDVKIFDKYDVIKEEINSLSYDVYVIDGVKYLRADGRLYMDYINIFEDETFVYIENKNHEVEILELKGKYLASYDFTKNNYNIKVLPDRLFYKTDLSNVILPNTLEEIGDYCFADTELGNINFPASLRKIGNHAFENCSYMDTVIFPENLEEIGEYSFSHDHNDNKIKTLIMNDKIESLPKNAFYFNSLNEVKLSCNLKYIYDYALYSYTSNNCDLIIPSSVEYIGRYSIYRMKNIFIPLNVELMDYSAISDINGSILVESKEDKIGWDINWNQYCKNIIYDIKQIKQNEKSKYAVKSNGDIIIYDQISESSIQYTSGDFLFTEGRLTEISTEGIYARDSNFVLPSTLKMIRYNSIHLDSNINVTIPKSVKVIQGEGIYGSYYNTHIYCEFESVPSSWNGKWNSSSAEVHWGQIGPNTPNEHPMN